MNRNNEHYQELVDKKGRTRFASCGYEDRFDPFILNKNERIKGLYTTLFRNYLADIPCDRVLDLGCGTGIYFDALSEFVGECEALDVSQAMIDAARDYCARTGLSTFHPRVGSAEKLDYEDASFDTVVAFDLLHHVEDLEQVIDEVHRILKPNGHFFVFEPNICNPLMFLAHLIPAEERLAMRRNRPARLMSNLQRQFTTVRWGGVCELITEVKGVKRMIFSTYLAAFRLAGIQKLFPRQAWLGRKQDVKPAPVASPQ